MVNPNLEVCANCTRFRGYCNTGYYCSIDKAEIDEYSWCKCFEGQEEL